MRAALLRVKIRNSDSENSRSTCFDWHNFIRTCINYEILLQILFFGLALFFKFLILTCFLKRFQHLCVIYHATFVLPLFSPPALWDEGVVHRPSVVVTFHIFEPLNGICRNLTGSNCNIIERGHQSECR